MTQVTFLQDYRGILSGEIFYEKGQVVVVEEAGQPLNLEELLAAGRVSISESVETEEVVDLMEGAWNLPGDEAGLDLMVEAGDLATVEIEEVEVADVAPETGGIMGGGW